MALVFTNFSFLSSLLKSPSRTHSVILGNQGVRALCGENHWDNHPQSANNRNTRATHILENRNKGKIKYFC